MSLRGDYVHAVIQVTRDMVPVVFSRWTLPFDGAVDLGVADLTLAQLVRIAEKENLLHDTHHNRPTSTSEWAQSLSTRIIPLKDLLQLLPLELGLSIELAYPSAALRAQLYLSRSHDLNTFVDAVLSTVYSTLAESTSSGERQGIGREPQRRKLVFSSFAPDVCAALNWKQPNYAVFFASDCGVWNWPLDADFSCSLQADRSDRRCGSVAGAVDFAKSNNLLGVLVNADILTKVPSLMLGIKDVGILLAMFSLRDKTEQPPQEPGVLDAVMRNGLLTFVDHTPRTGN
ncbi:hypothetical protein JB92DRAFT_738923 [Gautieria morchelliformis]|nr:hypothetical protein JB92DRAFT_738923 [Gautieria morchelliformis]